MSKKGSLYFSAKAFLVFSFVAFLLGNTPRNSTPFEEKSSYSFRNSGVVFLQIGQVSDKKIITFKLSVWAMLELNEKAKRRKAKVFFMAENRSERLVDG